MTIFIICSEYGATHGAFNSKESAEQEIKNLYKNGYFGGLIISEDELKD